MPTLKLFFPENFHTKWNSEPGNRFFDNKFRDYKWMATGLRGAQLTGYPGEQCYLWAQFALSCKTCSPVHNWVNLWIAKQEFWKQYVNFLFCLCFYFKDKFCFFFFLLLTKQNQQKGGVRIIQGLRTQFFVTLWR